jgi:hypothetical protein
VDEGDDEWEDVSDVPKAVKGAKKKKVKALKVFTPVSKVYSICVGMSTLFYCQLQIHCVAVHILRSEIHKKYRHLAFIRSMNVRWNMTLAELVLSGDCEFVDKLVKALEVHNSFFFLTQNMLDICQVFKLCTLEFSKKSVPTKTKVLSLYKLMEVTLTALATNYKEDEPTLCAALLAGAAVATKYISNALFSDSVLLGADTISFIIG